MAGEIQELRRYLRRCPDRAARSMLRTYRQRRRRVRGEIHVPRLNAQLARARYGVTQENPLQRERTSRQKEVAREVSQRHASALSDTL